MNFIRRISIFLRKIFLKFKKRNIQKDVTIISNNCTGGVMYSDLGLRFNTPTINLSFAENRSFYMFVAHIKDYIQNGTLTESRKKEHHPHFPNAPIGILHCGNMPDLEIHFLHYSTFEEAREKWFTRSKRVNFDKIFLVIEAQSEYEKSLIPLYVDLPYKKVIFTDANYPYSCCLKMSFYSKYGVGIDYPILKLCSVFGRRGYDEFDYVNEIFKRKDWSTKI